MRTITLIVIHCSAVRPNQTSSAKQIDEWHKERGFNGIGYHYVIRRDGTIELGRPEWGPTAEVILFSLATYDGSKAKSVSQKK